MKKWLINLILFSFFLSGCSTLVFQEPADDSKWTQGSAVEVIIEFSGSVPIDVSSFSATLNGASITASFTVAPDGASATLPALGTDEYELLASVQNTLGLPASGSLAFEVIDGGAAAARVILVEDDLISGPMAKGRLGDFLLKNNKIKAIIQDVGRDPLGFVSPYGGNIIDADLVRAPGEPDNDHFMAMSHQLNIESTFNATEIEVINDGANGGPAIVRATGVDDSLDYINASKMIEVLSGGLPLSVPESGDDNDIPVEIYVDYSLNPGDDFIKIETFIKNIGTALLPVYIGDYVVAQWGELDLFVPGIGFGEPLLRLNVDFMALRGEGSAEGLAYGYIPSPDIVKNSTLFSETGVAVTSLSQNVVGILLLGTPAKTKIQPNAVFSYVRYLAVAEDVAGVQDIRNAIYGLDTGILQGSVTVAGSTPLQGATVSVLQIPGKSGADYDVVSTFQTGESGEFRGSLPPGEYKLMAVKEGYPHDSFSAVPNMTDAFISPGGTVVVNLELPETGAVRFTAMDESGTSIPAKATLVGYDPSPPLTNTQSLLGLLELKGYVFDLPKNNMFGLAKVIYLGPDGDSGEVAMEPGNYQLFVSRGPEYSRYTEALSVSAGSLTAADAQIAHVIDTTGFVSGDFHVHMFYSPDSTVPLDMRVSTFLAEGVDYLVATDHEHLTDLNPTIAYLGAEDLIATTVGQEITPQDYGHFNGWPLTIDPDRRSAGALDWAREAPPGEDYRTLGAYCKTPGEIFQDVHDDPGLNVVQLNHFNSGGGAGLNLLGIDTGTVPPHSTAAPGPFRLDPSVTNLFSPDFDGLEMLIGNDRGQVDKFFNENLGDWFNLLNQGLFYFGSSDSDTHSQNSTQGGTFRNYIASSTDSPGAIDEDELTMNIRDGKMVGGYAPFLTATIHSDDPGQTGGHALGLDTVITTNDGTATFQLEMQSPIWAQFDTIQLYINTVPDAVDDDDNPATPPPYHVDPAVTLEAGVDFTINEINDFPAIPGARHFHASVEYLLTGLTGDTWIVAVVKGTDDISEPLFPVVPNGLSRELNAVFDDFLDGNLGEMGMMALGFTNPLFIDVDGNGEYDAPLAP